jgi:hypothetical protein
MLTWLLAARFVNVLLGPTSVAYWAMMLIALLSVLGQIGDGEFRRSSVVVTGSE